MPTLTGLGERVHLAHPDIDLETHIIDIVNHIEFEDLRDVTLAGHSLGGTVITGVADRIPGRLEQLISLDATIPQDGESFHECWPNHAASFRQQARAASPPGFVPVAVSWLQELVTDEAVGAGCCPE